MNYCLSSVQFQFSRSVVSDSLWPHESQYARPPRPSPNPGVHSDSCPSSQWCHPAISFSVIPFSSCPQFLLASESFPMSQLFAWDVQILEFQLRIIPSKEIPGLISFRMDWLDLLAVQGTLKSLLQHHSSKALILWCSAFFMVQLSHPYMTTGKTSSFWLLNGRYSSPSCMPLGLAGSYWRAEIPDDCDILVCWYSTDMVGDTPFLTIKE